MPPEHGLNVPSVLDMLYVTTRLNYTGCERLAHRFSGEVLRDCGVGAVSSGNVERWPKKLGACHRGLEDLRDTGLCNLAFPVGLADTRPRMVTPDRADAIDVSAKVHA